MVLVSKAEKKAVYKYLLQEGCIVFHKDFTKKVHKGTQVPNICVRMLLRSLNDRGYVGLVFSWQYFYYFLNAQGKKFISQFLGLTEDIIPLIWKYINFKYRKDDKRTQRMYQHYIPEDRQKRAPRPDGADRSGRPGERSTKPGGRGSKRTEAKEETPKPQAHSETNA